MIDKVKKILIYLLVAVLLLNVTACSQVDKDKTISPDVNETDEENLVYGNNVFAIDLYHVLKENKGNVFYSPYSISSALAMTYAGARGETEEQMADTLHFLLPQERLHSTFDNLSSIINSRGKKSENDDSQGFKLNNVNAIWGQKDYEFLQSFLDVMADNYDAGIRTLNFAGAPESSRLTINNWISEQTENRINNLLPAGSISTITRLILTNAIYFKADWLFQFSERRTGNGQFNLLDGTEVTVPMMKQTDDFGYAEGSGYQAVELQYKGEALSMVILLPGEDRFESFEDSLQYTRLQAIIGNLKYQKVILTMPRFEFSSEFGLGRTLSEMGMPLAFSSNADFSGITVEEALWIDQVIHKAFVTVDENGTEAAAVTAVMMAGAAPGQPELVEFTMDRPFIFLIRDIETNTILFIGRVLNPLNS